MVEVASEVALEEEDADKVPQEVVVLGLDMEGAMDIIPMEVMVMALKGVMVMVLMVMELKILIMIIHNLDMDSAMPPTELPVSLYCTFFGQFFHRCKYNWSIQKHTIFHKLFCYIERVSSIVCIKLCLGKLCRL